MMERTVPITVIYNSPQVAKCSRFMQAADLFEQFKTLVQVERMTATVNERFDREGSLRKMREAMQAEGFLVIAIFIPDDPVGAWRNPDIKVVSNGTHWGPLDDLLQSERFVGELTAAVS